MPHIASVSVRRTISIPRWKDCLGSTTTSAGRRVTLFQSHAFSKEGTEVRAAAWYDNSPNNPDNPNPNASVNWGDQPRDQVLGGFFDVAVPATIGDRKILVRHHSRP